MQAAAMQVEMEPVGAVASRDAEMVWLLGRHGIATVAQVMEEFQVGRTAAYRLVAACVHRGLIERDDSLRHEPSVLYATREGLRWVGLGYPVAKLSPSLIRHGLRCTSMAQELRREFPSGVHTERDLCWAERQEARPIASARMGTRPDGGPRLHRPDLAVLTEAGVIAVEVELTPKAPKRLEGIMRAWRRSPWVDGPLLLRAGRSPQGGRAGDPRHALGGAGPRLRGGGAMKHHHGHHREAPDLLAPLVPLTLMVVLGAAAGFCALLALRRAGLRFTWALVPAPLAYLAWLIDWHAGLVLFATVATAAGAGLYWHLEDIERGGEEAAKARDSLGVGRWLWALGQRRRLRERRLVKGRIALGTTRRGGVCWVPFGARQGVHSLIVGATGGGKTVTQAAIAQAHVLAGVPAIVLDPKGDEHLRATLIDAAKRSGMPFREWSPTGSAVYNPFERGNPTEIADKAIAGQRWSEEHYREASRRLLGKVLSTLRAAGDWPPTMSQVVRHMDPERLDALAAGVGGKVAEDVGEYVDGLLREGQERPGRRARPSRRPGRGRAWATPRSIACRDGGPADRTRARLARWRGSSTSTSTQTATRPPRSCWPQRS